MTGPAVVDGVDIDAVAAAVRVCPAVDDLYSSTAASVASYLPGRQVAGIRVDDGTVTVQVRSRWGIPVAEVAAQVRSAVRSLVRRRQVDVVIGDITDNRTVPLAATSPSEQTPTPLESARAPAPAVEPVVVEPPLPFGDAPEGAPPLEDEVVWTTSTGAAGGSSSAVTTPITAATRPLSSPG